MAITTLSQIGFYFLYESIFSPLFLGMGWVGAVPFHCRLSQDSEAWLIWVAGHFQ